MAKEAICNAAGLPRRRATIAGKPRYRKAAREVGPSVNLGTVLQWRGLVLRPQPEHL